MLRILSLLLLLGVLGGFMMPLAANAQVFPSIWEGVTCNESLEPVVPCTECDAIKVASNIVTLLVQIALVLGSIMIVYGALMMVVSAGNVSRYENAKKTMTAAIIGVLIALMSWVIINTVLHVLTGDPNFPWAEIECRSNLN